MILSFFVLFQREVDFTPSILGKKILQQLVFFNGEINSMAEKYSVIRTLQVAMRQYLGYCDFYLTRTQSERGEGVANDLIVKHSLVQFQSIRFLMFWIVTARISLVTICKHIRDFPGGASGKEPTCQCRRPKRHWFDPWDQEDPLGEDMATHSRILPWRIPWTDEPGWLQSIGLQRVGHE